MLVVGWPPVALLLAEELPAHRPRRRGIRDQPGRRQRDRGESRSRSGPRRVSTGAYPHSGTCDVAALPTCGVSGAPSRPGRSWIGLPARNNYGRAVLKRLANCWPHSRRAGPDAGETSALMDQCLRTISGHDTHQPSICRPPTRARSDTRTRHRSRRQECSLADGYRAPSPPDADPVAPIRRQAGFLLVKHAGNQRGAAGRRVGRIVDHQKPDTAGGEFLIEPVLQSYTSPVLPQVVRSAGRATFGDAAQCPLSSGPSVSDTSGLLSLVRPRAIGVRRRSGDSSVDFSDVEPVAGFQDSRWGAFESWGWAPPTYVGPVPRTVPTPVVRTANECRHTVAAQDVVNGASWSPRIRRASRAAAGMRPSSRHLRSTPRP